MKLRNSHPGLFFAFGLRAVYFLIFGLQIALLSSATSYAGYDILKGMLPMSIWGIIWAMTGFVMLLSILFDWRKGQLATCSVSIFLPLIWSIALFPTTAFTTYMFVCVSGIPLIKEPPYNPVTEKNG